VSATPVWSAQRQAVQEHVLKAVAEMKLRPVGRLPITTNLDLVIVLPLRNKEQLMQLLKELYDPADPMYRRYLTPQTFAEMFGPTERDYTALSDFAKANGLKVTTTHPNRTLLGVEGSVADIERLFHVTMRVYQHPREQRTFHAPDVEPTIDLEVPVLAIRGLDDFTVPQPPIRRGAWRDPTIAPSAGSAAGGLYRGDDLRAAYAPGVALDGNGQSVGIYNPHHGFLMNDIVIYETQIGQRHVPVINTVVEGSAAPPDGFSIEVTLDVEMAVGMAPGLTSVIVYEGDNITALNRMASDNVAKQLSTSWQPPPEGSSADQIYQQFAAQGQTFFSASADDGAYYPTVPNWADDPYITIVGGTVLTTSGPRGTWVSETTWQQSGGGSSAPYLGHYPIPDWQLGINMSANYGSTAYRNVPDVAAIADSVYIVLNGNGGGVGGTSASSPLWAGFNALVNQQRSQMGRPSVGFLNPTLYAVGKGSIYPSAFHDITIGNNLTPWNTQPNHDHQYFAQVGYDLCTGWGTPVGQSLINDLSELAGANWVDFNWTGSTQNETYSQPYKTLAQGVTHVLPGGTIAIKTTGSSAETMTINKAMTIQAVGGAATVGR
jgi:subtilase family serine protease